MNTKQSNLNVIFFAIFILISCEHQSDIQMPERGICAHRGASATHPENTMAAFKEAIRLGAHMIEFDVRQTKDGELVIIHDARLDETTNDTGSVSGRTFAELQALDAGSWKDTQFQGEKIPTLLETIQLMPRNTWLNIHIKADSAGINEIVKIIIEEERLHQAILACKPDIANAARKIDPRLLICNMDRAGSTAEYVANTIAMKADFIQLTTRADTLFSTIIPQLKQQGIRINYYGVKSKTKLAMILDAGVEFPLVDDISQAMQHAKLYGIEPLKPQY